MTIAQLIPLLLNLSMGLVVLGLALHTTLHEATYLLRRPELLGRSFLSMHGVMLVAAILLVLPFDLHPAIKIAVVALALSPVPPILPSKQEKAGGSNAYVMSLLVVMAVLALVVVPVGTLVLGELTTVNYCCHPVGGGEWLWGGKSRPNAAGWVNRGNAGNTC